MKIEFKILEDVLYVQIEEEITPPKHSMLSI